MVVTISRLRLEMGVLVFWRFFPPALPRRAELMAGRKVSSSASGSSFCCARAARRASRAASHSRLRSSKLRSSSVSSLRDDMSALPDLCLEEIWGAKGWFAANSRSAFLLSAFLFSSSSCPLRYMCSVLSAPMYS